MSKSISVGVIGAGVMGEALIAALISYGVKPELITISEKRKERADELVKRYGISVAELTGKVSKAQALLLVVKPQDMADVLAEIKSSLNPDAVVVTFAAGKTISFITDALGTGNPVIRVMPNTATLVGAGMAAISLGRGVSAEQSDFVTGFLAATGKVVEVPEDLQDAVTAASGSGPAYFFRFVEAMVEGAKALGLSQEIATELTVQTMIGAAKLLESSGKSATTLRENVTSPNGTTAAALASFDADNISTMVATAMKAARDRSQELA
ncbi:MAG: pyrroline-5-carboxylate reductase [Candidatus Planktophila sp.]|nr:pyrroline-5-carboxylate reductase [Candidatus Planktophila sp.]